MLHLLHVQRLRGSDIDRADVIAIFFVKGFVTVDFVFSHGFVGISDTDIRTLHSSFGGFKAGAIRNIYGRNFSRNENFSGIICDSKNGAHDRGHLFTVFHHFFLEILCIIYADFGKSALFVQAEYKGAAAVLIAERRNCII